MPTYEYECERCSNKFTVNKPISEYDRVEKCPSCKVRAKRILSAGIGFILKGEGFYANDYKK